MKKTNVFIALLILLFILTSCMDSDVSDGTDIKRSDLAADTVEMIDVRGYVLSDAKEALKKIGFTNLSVEPQSIWIDSNWTVTEQNVKAGKSVAKNTKIILSCVKTEEYIPPDEPNVVMPDVCGKLLPDAKTALKDLGFIHITAEPSSIWKESNWTVAEQNIVAGTEVGKQTEIVLTCMKTEEYIKIKEQTMIDVVSMTEAEAKAKLSDAGFKNIVVEYELPADQSKIIDDITIYTVVAQSVETGETIKAGDKIMLTCRLNFLTTDNNEDLSTLIDVSSPSDSLVRDFAEKYHGQPVEFEGCISRVTREGDYQTTYISLGNYQEGVYDTGARFCIPQQRFSGLYVNGAFNVSCGMNYHVYAVVEGYDASKQCIELSVIALVFRMDDASVQLEKIFPQKTARDAVRVAITNWFAVDVFAEDGMHYDETKFHSAGYSGEYSYTVLKEGGWTAKGNNTWHAEDIYLYSPAFKNIKKVSCDVTYDGNCYIVSNVKCKYAKAENIESNNPLLYDYEEMNPSSSHPYLTVRKELIEF